MNETSYTDLNEFKTFGELCEALAEQELPATVEDGYYVMRKGDLKHFIEGSARGLPFMLEFFMPTSAQVAS
ncbi:MAG: hypothetical protein ABI670_22215 [Chloroflexota bacterium]